MCIFLQSFLWKNFSQVSRIVLWVFQWNKTTNKLIICQSGNFSQKQLECQVYAYETRLSEQNVLKNKCTENTNRYGSRHSSPTAKLCWQFVNTKPPRKIPQPKPQKKRVLCISHLILSDFSRNKNSSFVLFVSDLFIDQMYQKQ